jgi:hypothetical protein
MTVGTEAQSAEELDSLFDEEDWPYCACDLEPTIEESDWGVCGCCGKPIS